MTQIFNRGGSLRYDMKGKKRKNHLANPVKKPIRILAKQKEVSPEVLKEVKRKQKEREDAKKDFFERLKKSVGSTTMHKSNAVPVFEDDKKLAKDIAKMRR